MTSARGRAETAPVLGQSRPGTGGFTLLELLVVLAIIALIGTVGAGAFQVARRNYSLRASAARIQGILRAARNTSISSGTYSYVVVDPTARTVSAHSLDAAGAWSFEALGGGGGGEPAAEPLGEGGHFEVRLAEAVDGRVGTAFDFRAAGAHVDCGNRPEFNVRGGFRLEAWVRHALAEALAEPERPAARGGGRKRSSSTGAARRRRERPSRSRERLASPERGGDPLYAIVEKEGAYFLGMTRSGALEAALGDYRVRTAGGVVAPGRWVLVSAAYDGRTVELAADGVPRAIHLVREDEPGAEARRGRSLRGRRRTGAEAEGPGEPEPIPPPPQVPVTPHPLTISSPDRSFPGVIDEVRLETQVEPLTYAYPEHEAVVGWKKVIHFDRHGHLDPFFHEGPVRIILAEPADPQRGPRTAVRVDFSKTFAEWAAAFDDATRAGLSEVREEEKILQGLYKGARYETIEVDTLGVVR